MPIGKLERVIIDTDKDGIQISRLPNNEEIINKINEMVDFLNALEVHQGRQERKTEVYVSPAPASIEDRTRQANEPPPGPPCREFGRFYGVKNEKNEFVPVRECERHLKGRD